MSRGVLALLAILALACGGMTGDPGSGEVATLTADAPDLGARLGAFAAELAARPGDRAAILAEHGLDEATLDSLLYAVAADAEQSVAYAQALGS